MTRSLAAKLILAFLVVAVSGTLVSTLVIGSQTLRQFDNFITQREAIEGERPRGPGVGPLPPGERPGFGFGRYAPNTPERVFERNFRWVLLYGAGGAVLLGILLALGLTRTITRPVRDLTEATQRLAHGELGHQVIVRSEDELGQLATSFNNMSSDLEKADRLRQQMTADVAHDLRTPLSILSGYTEALQDGKLQATPEMYQIMHQQVDQLRHLVDDLRTLSLADAGALPLNRRPVDPKALLERVFLAYMPQAEAQDITLKLDAPGDLPSLTVDVERMTQVLNNLVGNAMRFTPSGGIVTLIGRPQQLAVRDSGEGVAAADLPFIFDRFYRGDKARQRPEGESGLGLAIAKSIVDAHGGRIWAESEGLGRGATFWIEIE
ncbi:MAG: ATP-binding protein [Ardenticatenaceae bacterium]|nr:ATP-binding protein [Ardenticatenaceae bacterium]